ncbi:hypothetical protein LZ30DRAFT_784329 [Colletotrichum cereale]|nr:hypothetical protein LZ30DRAFT_784329 [Colletotrichum cereale]
MPSDSLKSGIYPVPHSQDNTTHDLLSTKCLGTFRSMATASPPTAGNRPLNHNVVFPPGTPPSRAATSDFYHPGAGATHDGSSPGVMATFAFSPVAALRVLAIPFAVALVIFEVQGRTDRNGLAVVFIVLASIQLAWLVVALLTQAYIQRRGGGGGGGGGGGQGNGFTVDLGIVECVFGRRRRRGDDAYQGEGMPAWMKDEGSKRGNSAGTVYTALDIAFGTITLTAGIVAATDPLCWSWGLHVPVAIIGIFLAVLEGVIALAQQFAVLRRGRIQVVWDEGEEEDDLGSHKYRIRLPQSPEQRHATMSVTA